MELNEKEDEEL